VLFRSRDRGTTWEQISPDLTRDDKSKQKWSGGPISGDNTGVEIYDTIFTIALSPVEKGTIWVGSDDGLVHVTRDDGASWQRVTPPGTPEWGTVDAIEPSAHAAGTAWVVVQAYRLDDQRPYLFRTSDHGKSWTNLSAGLPQDAPLFVVREDPKRPGLLFAGNELGLLVSRDAGATWEKLGGLPTVKVVDLVVKGDDLVVATSGRSLYILDDFSALADWKPELEARPAHLYSPRPARRWTYGGGWGEEAVAPNPPRGAVIHYSLAKQVEGELQLEIRDAKGRLVRTLRSTAPESHFPADDPDEGGEAPKPALSTEAGLHRVVWNFRWEGQERPKGMKIDLFSFESGPLAVPGRYALKLIGAGVEAGAELVVEPDPRSRVAPAALEASLELSLAMLESIRATLGDIAATRAIAEQANDLSRRLAGDAEKSALVEAARRAAERAAALERKLHNADAEIVYDILARPGGTRLLSKLVFAYETSRWGDGPPTQGVKEVFTELETERAKLHGELEALVVTEVAEVERLTAELGVPRIVAAPPSSAVLD
jgi:hypothetical protein